MCHFVSNYFHPRSSSRILPSALHFLGSCSGHEFLLHLGSRWPPENRTRVRLIEPHPLRRSRTRLRVQQHHKHASVPVYLSPLACARVVDVRILLSEHDNVASFNNGTRGSHMIF